MRQERPNRAYIVDAAKSAHCELLATRAALHICLHLQVMDSLYQARVKKNETDLLIDQLKEALHYLTVQNKVGPHADITHAWHVCSIKTTVILHIMMADPSESCTQCMSQCMCLSMLPYMALPGTSLLCLGSSNGLGHCCSVSAVVQCLAASLMSTAGCRSTCTKLIRSCLMLLLAGRRSRREPLR